MKLQVQKFLRMKLKVSDRSSNSDIIVFLDNLRLFNNPMILNDYMQNSSSLI